MPRVSLHSARRAGGHDIPLTTPTGAQTRPR